jgi:hypothetical protein
MAVVVQFVQLSVNTIHQRFGFRPSEDAEFVHIFQERLKPIQQLQQIELTLRKQ